MYNEGDLVFVANAESAPMIEHIFTVVKILEDGFVLADKVLTINKVPQQGKGMTFIPIPSFGLLSNAPALENGNFGKLIIKLNNFDISGIVTDPELKKFYENYSNKLIVATSGSVIPAQKGIVGNGRYA